jgi:acyl dehydratase
MEISPHFVGAALKPHQAQVAWRTTTNHAAALADANPIYFDDTRPGGILAHPLFATTLTWPVLAGIPDYLQATGFPHHVLRTQVHYTEHLAFHRPLRPGDALAISGRISAILPHRAGAHVVVRFDAADREGGPIFTEHVGALLRGVRCAGEGRGGEALPQVFPRPAPVGPMPAGPCWQAAIAVEPLRPYLYDGCTGISFPIHTSPQFAQGVGLPGIILQGMATLGFAVRELVDREAGGDPSRLSTLHARFGAMVRPGTEIQVRLAARVPADHGAHLFFDVLNQAGEKAVRDGYAFLR